MAAKKTIVLTGTHLTPALALIDHLKQDHWQIVYLGRQPYQAHTEKQLLPQKNIRFISLISPKFSRHQPFVSLLALIKFPLGLIQAWFYLNQINPSVVVSFGGHVALPVCLAASLKRLPLVIHEQTFQAGLTSKLTHPLAKKIAVSWPASAEYFNPQKTVLTGNPIRQPLADLKSVKSSTPAIYITGGNQGSQVINQTVNQVLLKLLDRYTIYHQFGLAQSAADWEKQQNLRASLPLNLRKKYYLKRWFSLDDLVRIFKRVNLVISRAGINTVTELAYLQKPAILIPLPHTQKNEQDLNANYLKDLGLAVILPQSDLSPGTLLLAVKQAFKTLPKKSLIRFPHDLVKQASHNLYQLILSCLRDR